MARARYLHSFCSKYSGLLQVGGLGGPAPQFLADQFTLSQPGGHILPTQYYVPPPPDFQNLRRPWYWIFNSFARFVT